MASSPVEPLGVEVDRLRSLLLETMDSLAEQVLEQIQVTRGMASATEAVRNELKAVAGPPPSASEQHLQRVCERIQQALRDTPESIWDDFGTTCAQFARTLRRATETDN